MDTFKRISFTLFICIVSFSLFAGNTDHSKPENKDIRKADNLFIFSDYRNALPIYLKLINAEPENAEFNYRLGVCYYYCGTDVLKGLPYFEKAKKRMQEDTEDAIDLYYYLGTTYHMLNRFDEAMVCYTKLKSVILPDKQGQDDIKDLEEQIAACKRGKEAMLHPVKVQLINPGTEVNSEFADYAPVITKDQSMMLFTSKRKESTGGRIDEDGYYYEDVFISKKTKEGNWSSAAKLDTADNLKKNYFRFSKSRSLGNSINTKEHDASVALSPDGKQLYIYRLDDVWVSDYKNDKWSKPSRLNNFISSRKNHEPSLSLTMDERTLYFVSEREGGYGGKDIYMSAKLADGSWGEPRNLGPSINTEYDEDAPFIDSENNILYFSSEAHGSIGGFDVFKSRIENGNWSEPENLGYPINSGANDIFYVYNSSLKTAYFSSIREGGTGNYDIYMVDYNPKKITPVPLINTMLAVTLDNQIITSPVSLSISSVNGKDQLWQGTEGKNEISYKPGETYSIIISTPETGKYETMFTVPENSGAKNNYQEIAIEKIRNAKGVVTGYITKLYNAFFNLDSAVSQSNHNEKDKAEIYTAYVHSNQNNPALKKIAFESHAGNVDKKTTGDLILFEPVRFDFASAELDTKNLKHLDEIIEYLNSNEKSSLIIVGYTDSKGDENYNKKLSLKRAMNVRDYIIMKGGRKVDINCEGLGENTPAAPNESTDGIDNPEGRALNRRVEFNIKEQ